MKDQWHVSKGLRTKLKKLPLANERNPKNNNCDGLKHIKNAKIHVVKIKPHWSLWRMLVMSQHQNAPPED